MTNSLMALLVNTASLMAALASWLVLRWVRATPAQPANPSKRYRKPEGQSIPRIGGAAIGLSFLASLILGLCLLDQTDDVLKTWSPCLLTIGCMFLLGL